MNDSLFYFFLLKPTRLLLEEESLFQRRKPDFLGFDSSPCFDYEEKNLFSWWIVCTIFIFFIKFVREFPGTPPVTKPP